MAVKKVARPKKKASKAMDALVFIDTNILLDFYRYTPSTVSELLLLIESNVAELILTEQVEMEFKKNRQGVLQKWISDSKKLNGADLNVSAPAYLRDDASGRALKKGVETAKSSLSNLQKKVEAAIEKPKSDEVYKRLSLVFAHNGPYVMNRSKPERLRVRHLARTRFLLGYPPRKSTDNAIGDAVNWEWMIECVAKSKKHLIIVTKDTDFGVEVGTRVHLNDWLLHEFRERTSVRRKVVITRKITDAFKLLKKRVSAEAVNAVNVVASIPLGAMTAQATAQASGIAEAQKALVDKLFRNLLYPNQRFKDSGGESPSE